jgi:hypothetical protein
MPSDRLSQSKTAMAVMNTSIHARLNWNRGMANVVTALTALGHCNGQDQTSAGRRVGVPPTTSCRARARSS